MPEPLSEHAIPYLLVTFRLAGLFIFAPLIGGWSVPMRARALLAASVAAAVYPALPATFAVPPRLDLISLGPLIFSEAIIGAAIGVIAALPLYAMQIGGMLMGYQMGLGMARSYDPTMDTETDEVSTLFFYIGVAVFVALGGLDAMFLALLRSFEHVPVGGVGPGAAPVDLYVGVLTSGFVLAVRVAMPVLGVIALQMISMGFLMKTMPQINILSVGFPIKIICGVIVMIAALGVIGEVAGQEITAALESLAQWVESL